MEGRSVIRKRQSWRVWALASALGLSACAEVPTGAPTVGEFRQATAEGAAEAPTKSGQPLFIDVDAQVLEALGHRRAPGFAATFGKRPYKPTLILGPGDTISIAVFDFSAVPLFAGAAPAAAPATQPHGNAATIPTQTVEADGTVAIPFGGAVKVSGLTPEQAGKKIEQALKGAASDMHVVVTALTSNARVATAGGELGRPGIVPLTLRGERVLDLISEAGGAKFPAQDCDVDLIRQGRVATVNLQQVVDNPEENVRLQPGDTVYVSHNARSFSVLGAALKVSQYDFDKPRVTLAEALARAGGPNAASANISDIYLLRSETKATLDEILGAEPDSPLKGRFDGAARTYPVAYHVDLRHADGYFQSRALPLGDKDLIVVAGADGVQWLETLQIVRNVTGIVYDVGPLLTK